ncbi:MAG: DNA mismatch repair endonuclease MutL [Bacteroidales bacterium]|jgi:DNA mismatch repair protein MutL|nr:DNA mismatch repair endonuclease MutL [Bacteroidales bacterium]
MSDIIKLLPDSVANQIAAGEVVQRPASVVKELLENSVDARATDIQLILKEAGSTLIQVIDNGGGMTESDARMSFERHATSKIAKADDLFSIKTLGFRGEALASIAAVAQVEMRTRTEKFELGTEIIIEASRVKSQSPCSTTVGTSIAVKNLFFNVPARRKFLKSYHTELHHAIDEFVRIALVNNDITFSLISDGKTLYHLHKSNLKQRIVGILGKEYNERLLPVEAKTDYVSISGFIGKPEYSKKSRGEQFFFVNRRFIRSPFLHHSVEKAYKELLPENSYPAYCIFFEIAPEDIDINIHPTKTEIKFTNEQMVYAFLSATVKKSLGQFNITPSIDFDDNPGINIIPGKHTPASPPSIRINPDYDPFAIKTSGGLKKEPTKEDLNDPDYLDKLFGTPENVSALIRLENENYAPVQQVITPNWEDDDSEEIPQSGFLQIGTEYIVTNVKSGMMLIRQQRAFERILFERNLKKRETKDCSCQRLMFPKTIELNPVETVKMNALLPEMKEMGFDVADFGQNTFIIHGIPAALSPDIDPEKMIHELIETEDIGIKNVENNNGHRVALFLARFVAAKKKGKMTEEAINNLINELFATSMPTMTPDGSLIIKILSIEELSKLL